LPVSRSTPLMRIASEPQMPWAQLLRNDSVPSRLRLMNMSPSSSRSAGAKSTLKSSNRGAVSVCGLKLYSKYGVHG
jgi:hypothetical protein